VQTSPQSSDQPTAPSISVVICAYTLERIQLLGEGIEALATQTLAPFEVVLVSDNSAELEAEAVRRWPDVRVIPNQEPQGLSGARNTGLAAARGDVVAFLDDDATPAPDWIERMSADYLDPAVLGVGGTVTPRWERGQPAWFPPEFYWVVGCTHSGMPKTTTEVRNVIGANMSFRRDALLEVDGFRREFGRVGKDTAGAEETDLCIRIGARHPEGRILYDPAVAVEHFVPASRGTVEYFLERCRGEGRSKATLARLVGSDSGLSDERTYVRSTLPRGFFAGLGETARGHGSGAQRSAMIFAGLASTSWAYATAKRPKKIPAEVETTGEAPLRIQMVTPRSPLLQGGVERHVMEVSRRMAAAGETVEVLYADPGRKGTEEVREGVDLRGYRAWPAERDYLLAPGIWRGMKKGRPEIVHVQSYHTLVAPLAMLRALVMRVPYVVTFHGGGHSSAARNSARTMQRRLLRPLLRRAAKLVAVARFEIEEYGAELGLGPDRFALIPNGTDLAFSSGEIAAGIERDADRIASVGRLERYKGHHRVIAAFPTVLAARPDAHLLIVGKGPYEDELRKLAAELGIAERVEFTSTAPDRPEAMAELLRSVSTVVLMSEFETHPLVALEAAAAGCRLVVADASGLGEIAADGFATAVPLDAPAEEVGAATLAEMALPPQTKKPNLSSWDECAADLVRLYRTLV
jgi:glucosyl-dolichyl phosphate glucuronosyltransferase